MRYVKTGLFFGDKEILRARQMIAEDELSRKSLRKTEEFVSSFDRFSRGWWRDVLPGKGAIFAHGYRGCPACRTRWKWYGQDVATLDRPFLLTCPGCKTVFDLKEIDDGPGVFINNRSFKLRGIWNSFLIKYIDEVMENSSLLYAVTGDEFHLGRACFIADYMASVCATTTGPAEMPTPDGRFLYYSSIVNRRKVIWSMVYDLLCKTKEFNGKSEFAPSVSISKSFEINMLRDYLFDHCAPEGDEWARFHNHDADTMRAMLAVGIVLEDESFLELVKSTFGYFVENTIDNRGFYNEISVGYANFTAELYVQVAVMLARLKGGMNFFNDKKLLAILDNPDDREDCSGHLPRYGDVPADHGVIGKETSEFYVQWETKRKEAQDTPMYGSYWYDMYDQRFLWQRLISVYSDDVKVKTAAIEKAKAIAFYKEEKDWFDLFYDWENPADNGKDIGYTPDTHSPLHGFRGIGILRNKDYSCLIQAGANMPHCHDDILGINLYGLGRDLSLDIGYELYSTPFHYGFGKRRIAHNGVVIDEDTGVGGDGTRLGCANMEIFSKSGVFKVTSASYDNIHGDSGGVYRRKVCLIDVDGERSYFLDIFNVSGGEIHDYSFHGTHPQGRSSRWDDLKLVHLEKADQDGQWVLASWGKDDYKEFINSKGRSWGERVVPGGYISDMNGDEPVGDRGWSPKPENGYGFLFDVKLFKQMTDKIPEITWNLGDFDQGRLTCHYIVPEGSEFALAKAPTLYGEPFLNYSIVRNKKKCNDLKHLESCFSMVIDPHYEGKKTVREVKSLNTGNPNVFGIVVTLFDGSSDYIFSAMRGFDSHIKIELPNPLGTVEFCGEFAALRVGQEGRIKEIKLVGPGHIKTNRVRMELPQKLNFEIEGYDGEKGIILREKGNSDDRKHFPFVGCNLHVKGRKRDTLYPIKGVHISNKQICVTSDMHTNVLGRSRIKEIGNGELLLKDALTWGFSQYGPCQTGFLAGKTIEGAKSSTKTILEECLSHKRIRVRSTEGFLEGEDIIVHDISPGDEAFVLPIAKVVFDGRNPFIQDNTDKLIWEYIPWNNSCSYDSL